MKEVLARMFRIGVIALLAMICNFPTHAKAQGVQKPAKLYGKVAVIMKNGDVKPAPKQDFCLTTIDLWGLFMQLTKEGQELYGPAPESYGTFNKEYFEKDNEFWKKVNDYRVPKLREAFQKAVNQRKCFTFKTEFDGSYSIDNIPPGEYRIVNYSNTKGDAFFFTHIGNSSIQWNLPITLKAGQNTKLDLSNENAAKIDSH